MGFTSEPLVSILTPVYNGEKYLIECVESILNQTYQNWEYIIVNNCSTDKSFEIAQSYAKKDERIRVHNNPKFLSMVQNENNAFRQISPESKYCKMVHADDWLFPECLTQMVAVAEAHPSVAIVSAYRLDGVWVNLDGLPYPSTVVPGRVICRSTLLGGPYVFGSPTSLLISSDCVRSWNEFYDEAGFSIHSDTAACYEVLQNHDFGFVHQVLTYTRRHNDTATLSARDFNSYVVENFKMLKRYGPIYLQPCEYKERLKYFEKIYLNFLAKNLFRRWDKCFWEYHYGVLNALGLTYGRVKLLKEIAVEILNAAINPGETSKKVFRLIRKQKNL